ncbi:biopolymer transporter ExbD [candidate division WOR-3 bacterium]|nr:biopolymer transporter ExbD [candidate division WOR-3 bacterium]
MRFNIKRKIPKAAIPTASMADIAFLLIVFFMLTTVFALEKGLQIVLPEKGEVVKLKEENIAMVYVNAKGQVRIDGRDVSIEDISSKAKAMLAENDKLVFSIRADRRCRYEIIIEVFDQLKMADARRVAFAPPKRREKL